MSASPTPAPILDRLLSLNGPSADPDRRFTNSLTVFVLVAALFSELTLTVAASLLAHPWAAAVHGALAACVLGLGAAYRFGFRQWAFAAGVWVIAWASSVASLTIGMGAGALLWHLFLPTAVLLLVGEQWGSAVLGADACLAVLQELWFRGAFSQWPNHPGVFLLPGWELGSILLFVLFFLFLRLIRRTMAAYRDEKGQTLDLLSQTRTSEARWADQARFQQTLMDVIPFPLFHKGTDGRYITANASFRVVFDVQRDAITGQRSEDILLPENARTLAKIELDVYARDSMAVEETVLIHADGHPHNFIVYLMPFVDAGQSAHGSIGVLIDITERKLREGKLVELNATKDQLFSIISHDLRGPVGKLKQLLDIYIDDPSIFDKATWDQVFHDMRRSSDSLFQLLENLLSWARAQQDRDLVHYESIALEPVIGDVFSVLKLLANDKRITLEMSVGLNGPVLTDRHALSTIIRNLVHNALKFTMPGGKITVTAKETVDDLWIEVRDTGVGMAEETVKRIFEKKERLTTFGTAKERGQGIGIGLCQELAASLGANLEAESGLGRGTAIRLHLPTPEL
jgi:PAS domain S-box-containing protein